VSGKEFRHGKGKHFDCRYNLGIFNSDSAIFDTLWWKWFKVVCTIPFWKIFSLKGKPLDSLPLLIVRIIHRLKLKPRSFSWSTSWYFSISF
jgi:hypothetical protein